jgi:hypothetical protein
MLIIGACNSSNKNEVISSIPQKKTPQELKVIKCEEYLDVDSMKIDGIVKYENELNNIVNMIGRPDSIQKKEDGLSLYNDSTYEVYYYKAYDFLVYDNKAYIDRIKFADNDVQVSFSHIKFNSNTTLEYMKNEFPCNFKDNNNDIKIKNEKYKFISIPVKPALG